MHCQPTALGEVAPECIREGGTGNGDPMHAQVCSPGPARGILLLFGARHASVGEFNYFSWLCGTRGACECIASPRRSGKCAQNAFAKAVPKWFRTVCPSVGPTGSAALAAPTGSAALAGPTGSAAGKPSDLYAEGAET